MDMSHTCETVSFATTLKRTKCHNLRLIGEFTLSAGVKGNPTGWAKVQTISFWNFIHKCDHGTASILDLGLICLFSGQFQPKNVLLNRNGRNIMYSYEHE